MQQAVDEDGVIWNVDAQGNAIGAPVGRAPVSQPEPQASPKPFTVGTPRAPEPKAPYRWTANDGSLMEVGPDGNPRRVFQDSPKPTGEGGGGAKADARAANLRALRNNIDRVRSLYQKNLRGGAPNQLTALVPDMLNPALGQFDSAGAGLSETGLAAFRVPGVGSQSDAELRAFVDANRPSSTDSDLQIEEKLRNLENRLNANMQEMGVEPPQAMQTAPAPPPSDSSGVGPTGSVTSRGGFIQVPSLKGIGREVASMVDGGASSDQVMQFLAQRYADTATEHGGKVRATPEQKAWIDDIIAKRRAEPDKPLSDFAAGWDRLGGYEAPEADGGVLGSIADGSSFLGEFGKDASAGVMSAGNAVTGGNLANLAGSDAGDVLNAARDESPWSSFGGDMLGSGLAMYGLAGGAAKAGLTGLTRAGGIGGDMLYGGVRGASETEGGLGDKAAGGLFGLAAAGGGNLLGRGIVSGAGRATRGVSNEAVRMLNERGISMTPGQILGQDGFIGRRLGALENAIESVPFIGGNFRDRRMQGVGEYGRAQLEENLGSIGYDAVGDQFSGDMLADAQRAVGDSYGFLDGRTFQSDPQFVNEIAAALQTGRSVPRVGDEFGAIMDRQVSPNLPPNGAITGRGFQDTLQTLRTARSDFAKDGTMGNMAGDAVGDVEAALMGMVQRQAPETIEDLARSNQAYAGLVPIENASITATNADNMFTPAQYGRAAVNNTRKFGGRAAAARGDIPGGDLQRAAQQVLPSQVPNSGTADREMAALLLPAALGGGAVAAQGLTDDPVLTALLATLGAASTRTGQRTLQRAMVDRPDLLRQAGERVYQLRDIGGRGGSALGAGSIPWLLANE